tara:strand:- start:292 stop:495 length:204 start_codon:yes stop_codon:yes gene_type:complete
MYTTEVIKHFGSQSAVARALGISHNAVGKWGRIVPLKRALKIQGLEDCNLKLDLSLYGIDNHPQSAA